MNRQKQNNTQKIDYLKPLYKSEVNSVVPGG